MQNCVFVIILNLSCTSFLLFYSPKKSSVKYNFINLPKFNFTQTKQNYFKNWLPVFTTAKYLRNLCSAIMRKFLLCIIHRPLSYTVKTYGGDTPPSVLNLGIGCMWIVSFTHRSVCLQTNCNKWLMGRKLMPSKYRPGPCDEDRNFYSGREPKPNSRILQPIIWLLYWICNTATLRFFWNSKFTF